MANERYINRDIVINSHPLYRKLREQRDVHFIRQYSTAQLKYPTVADMASLTSVAHLWKLGDRYWKLAANHYDDPELWWLIGWYNKKPTEAHLRFGDVIYIPTPLERVLAFFD